jgi:amino acid transporter
VWGSYACLIIASLCIIAQFYVALYPVGGPDLDAENFFMSYLAGPVILFFYVFWKVYSYFYVPEHRPWYIPIKEIDIYSGMREGQRELISGQGVSDEQRRASIAEMQAEKGPKGPKGWAKSTVRFLF